MHRRQKARCRQGQG